MFVTFRTVTSSDGMSMAVGFWVLIAGNPPRVVVICSIERSMYLYKIMLHRILINALLTFN